MNRMIAIGALFAFVILLGAIVHRAYSHDVYGDWKMPGNPGVSCCSDHDCKPVRASSDMDGNWTAWVDGKPVDVPADKILHIKSPDGRSHWCGREGITFCFVPGELRS